MNGKKLKELRKKSELTQKEFSEIFNVAQATTSEWENEKKNPDAEMLKNIANYFQVSIDYLMDNEESIQENELTKLERKLTKEEKLKLSQLLRLVFEDKFEEKKE